jgi:AcrR family transcriptional regulator
MKAKPRPRTKPPEVRREEIMDAAQRLFLRQGVAATTIDDVAAGADVAKGTVYLHFTSKQTLLAASGSRRSIWLASRRHWRPHPSRTGPESSRRGPQPA